MSVAADYEPAKIPPYVERAIGVKRGASDDVVQALSHRFVDRVRFEQPEALGRLGDAPVLYMANHQVGIESFLFCCLVSAIRGGKAAGLAKAEHATSWFGRVLELTRSHPDVRFGVPGIILIRRGDPASLVEALAEVAATLTAGASVLLHVEGTRARREGHVVRRFHPALAELAVRTRVPVVPARFLGGLPDTATDERYEFPVGYGRQVYCVGEPIAASALAALDGRGRVERIARAINALGAGVATSREADADFASEVAAWTARTGVAVEFAVVATALRRYSPSSADARAVLARAEGRPVALPAGERGRWIASFAALIGGSEA